MSGAVVPVSDEDLAAYADGRLLPERAASVEAWLASPENAADRARLERWRLQDASLRAALDPVLAEPLPAALRAVLGEARPPLRARRSVRWLAPAAVAAGIGIAIGVGGSFALWGAPPAVARGLADSGMSAHAVYSRETRHAVEVGADDEAHLVSWLSNRLDTPISPPDLSAEGLTFLGGRLVPDGGRPAAQLMYEDGAGQRYTLFIARTDEPGTAAMAYAWEPDICAFYWVDGTVGYVFAGPENRRHVEQLSRAVYDQIG
ncbi:MAG: anti-sigma factor [Bauldia sp.]|nr:anti-sigma factor [Bauldia sp.]